MDGCGACQGSIGVRDDTPSPYALADEPLALKDRIETAVRAGAARLPLEERPKSEIRTYDPKNVRVTFTVDGKEIELKGFSDGALIVDDPDEAVEDLETASRIWSFFSTSASAAEMLALADACRRTVEAEEVRTARHWWLEQECGVPLADILRKRKRDRRRALRRQARARKRRRGW